MQKQSNLWREIFTDLCNDDGCYKMGEVNFYKLASYIEDLYIRIEELESENVGTTNALYEIENRIDFSSQPLCNEVEPSEPPRMCGEMIFTDEEE